MKNLVIFHIPRTAGKWVHETVGLNGFGPSVKWKGHIPLRDSSSFYPLSGSVAVTVRDPLSWYQSQENFTKFMAEPNPMKLLTEGGRFSLDEALSRMESPAELEALEARWPRVSFFKHKLTASPWGFLARSGLGLWSWSIVNALSMATPRWADSEMVMATLSKVFLIRQSSLREDLEVLFNRPLTFPAETSLERDDRSSEYQKEATKDLSSRHGFVEREMAIWDMIENLDQSKIARKKTLIPLLRGF